MKEFYASVFGCILVLGLPLNAVSLWILLCYHGLKSPNAVFMINLAISDLMLAITLPLRIYFYATGTWPLDKMSCVFITMLFRNNIRSSSIFITFISVDRLLAVVFPLRSRHIRTPSNAVKGAAFAWLCVVLMNIPEGVSFSRYLNSKNESTCFESVYSGDSKKLSPIGYIQATLILVMLAVNIGCTAKVFWTLCHQLSDSMNVNSKMKVMVLFVLNLVMFIICFAPVSVIPLIQLTNSDITPVVCLATVNCCLDPLCYYFSLDAFWKKSEQDDVKIEIRTHETE
ncbi:lysophosphatidic acid receptor 6-like [Cyprinodon tularosa]|uniref:lysophosphatidic acid receptor 6-like n=1 Tax=Cyprinodon tularosa TaxID=77115 RepID=UPI0018E21AF5|nr:lysophosphatidic acid receptor 6-like [Cyprinodon tularosa]